MKLDRNAADAVYRNNFGAFTYAAFEVVNPGQRLIATGISTASVISWKKWSWAKAPIALCSISRLAP
jgi:hypothetical protein